jgi:hypothetical protein
MNHEVALSMRSANAVAKTMELARPQIRTCFPTGPSHRWARRGRALAEHLMAAHDNAHRAQRLQVRLHDTVLAPHRICRSDLIVVDTIMPKTVATATMDRLLRHAHLVLTNGDSLRLADDFAEKG